MDKNHSYTQSLYYEERTDKGLLHSKTTTISDVLGLHYTNQPDREALVFVHTDGLREVVTYQQLWENVNILAKSFIKLGVRKSEFVAVSMRSCPEWVYTTYGAILAGACPISLSLTYTDGSDVVAMMEKLQTCSVFVLDPGVGDANWKILNKIIDRYDETGTVVSEKMPYLRYLICHDRSSHCHDALALSDMMLWDNSDCPLPALKADDIALLLQTSGSTGIPKAAAHTHTSLIAGGIYYCERISGYNDIHYNDRPFTWVGGFPFSVLTGETRVLLSGFSDPPEDFVGFIIDVGKREKCSSMLILAPRLNELIQRQDEVGSDWSVQKIGTGGQPIGKTFAKCIGKLCKRFVCGYGSTETIFNSAVSIAAPDEFLDYEVGCPNPGVAVKIVDKTGVIVPPNERGEICIKSDALFKEYYNDTKKTSACKTDDGWLYTGDVGYMSEAGIFFCQGRMTDDIITGGINVPPAILEALMETIDGVSRVICVPVPHDVMFQVICACVIVKEGSDVTEEELRRFCEEIHNDKPRLFTVLPTHYIFMSKFPETHSGKIARRELAKIAKNSCCPNSLLFVVVVFFSIR